MKPAWRLGWLLFVLWLAGTSRAWADNPRLAGDYRLDSAASDDLPALVEKTVDEMNVFKRFFARRRLLHTNPAHAQVGIRLAADSVNVLRKGLPPIHVPLGGQLVDWSREDGEHFRVACVWEGDVLAQRFLAEDGDRMNRYRLSPDGHTLTLEVRITSPRLSAPFTYRLIYRRLP